MSSRTGDVVTAEHLLASVQLRPEAAATLHTGHVLRPVSGAAGSAPGVPSFSVDYRDGDPPPAQADAATGSVKLLHLDRETVCAAIDLHQTYRGKPAVTIVGTVRLPVVDAGVVAACPPASACTREPRPL